MKNHGRGAGLMMLTALACGVTGVPAVQAQQSAVITFEEAIDLALDRNVDLQRARADVELRNVLETRERMNFLPSLSVSARGNRSFGRSFSQQEGTILSETNNSFDTGMNASINLFDGFEKFATLERASLQGDASRLRLERTRQDVVFQVVEGFTLLVLARELAQVRVEELNAANELVAQVRRLVDVGRQPLSDLYQQQAVAAGAEAALVEAERQVELAENGLMQLLQLDPLGDFDFRAEFAPATDTTEAVPQFDMESLLARAYEQRSDLDAARVDLAASGQGVRAARAGWMPSLDLSFSYGSNWSGNARTPVPGTGLPAERVTITPDGGGDPVTITVPGTGQDPDYIRPGFIDQLDGRRGGSVGLSVSIPVFDRLQTWTAVEQARTAQTNARYDVQELEQQVALQVRQSLLEYRSAVAQERAAARREEAAARASVAAERRYELGAATFVEVVQARAQLTSARADAVSARYNVLLARRLIDYYTGSLERGVPFIEDQD